MKAENITRAENNIYQFSGLKSYKYNLSLYVSGDPSNCKLSYIHQAGSLQNVCDEEKLEIINFLLKHCKGCVIINTISKKITDFIEKNYPTYYYNEVPIGYSKTYQYHICIKNTIVVNQNCLEPKKIKIEGGLDTKNVSIKLKETLKKYRRKDDYVEEFINSL